MYIYTITLKSPTPDGDPIVLKSRHLHLLVEAINKYTDENLISDTSNIRRLQNISRANKNKPPYMIDMTKTPIRDHYSKEYEAKFNEPYTATRVDSTVRYRIVNICIDDRSVLNEDHKPTRESVAAARSIHQKPYDKLHKYRQFNIK